MNFKEGDKVRVVGIEPDNTSPVIPNAFFDNGDTGTYVKDHWVRGWNSTLAWVQFDPSPTVETSRNGDTLWVISKLNLELVK